MSARANGEAPNIELPMIQWQETHELIKEHYQRWIEMFNKITDNYRVAGI